MVSAPEDPAAVVRRKFIRAYYEARSLDIVLAAFEEMPDEDRPSSDERFDRWYARWKRRVLDPHRHLILAELRYLLLSWRYTAEEADEELRRLTRRRRKAPMREAA